MAEARPLAVGQPLTLHHETPIRLVAERKEKVTDLVQEDTKPPANSLKTTVINLSNVQLSEAEIKLLSRGLTFVPTPQCINWSEIQADIEDFARRLRLK